MVGKTISHYKIFEKLGEGGMGVVYKAEDTKLKRTVALKFLAPQALGSEEERARFVHEAQAAAGLNHPNICTIHEIDESEGQTFIAMECVEGQSLKARLEAGPLKPPQAVEIAAQIARGLKAAHEKGVVHRDIKPANIMVTPEGRAKIMDFGLAKSRGRAKLTRTGSTLGTVAYMSPEQVRGEDVDARSDIWSLGVILYEMIGGALPFKGDYEPSMAYSILNQPPAPLESLRSGVPAELDRIVTKSLEKELDKRYRGADELLADMEHLSGIFSGSRRPAGADTEGIKGPRPSVAYIDTIRSRRRVHPLAWIGLAVALIAAGLLLYGRFFRSDEAETVSERKMIVVLPFENLGSPDDDYFADGVTEEITSRLAGFAGLGVISRTSAFKYKSAKLTVKEIGKELGVDYVLEGTVRWEQAGTGGSRVRITPQLIRVSDDSNVWSDRYDRDLKNIFEVQSQIAESVIGRLNVTLMGDERRLAQAPTNNLDAYQAYLRGMDLYRRPRLMKEDLNLAVQMYERAVSLDPEFALAYSELSLANSRMYNDYYDRAESRLDRAKAAVDRALELRPGLPEAHLSRAYYYYWGLHEYDQALRELAIAAKGLPNDTRILRATGYIQRRSGNFEAALESLRRALELDPTDAGLADEIASTYSYSHRYAEADGYYDRAISLAPDFSGAYGGKAYSLCLWKGDTQGARRILEAAPGKSELRNYWYLFLLDLYDRKYEELLGIVAAAPDEMLDWQFVFTTRSMLKGMIYHFMGNTELAAAHCDSAIIQLERIALKRPEDDRIHSSLGFAYAWSGRKADAIREAKLALELSRAANDALFYMWRKGDLASTYVAVGEYEAALDEIEYLLSNPSLHSVATLRLNPSWDPLRENPRFKQLLEEYSASN